MKFFDIIKPRLRKKGEEYISLSEAAELSPYSEEHLILEAQQGELKAKKIGDDWFTKPPWIGDYVIRQEKKKIRAGETFLGSVRLRLYAFFDILLGHIQEKIPGLGLFRRIFRFFGARPRFTFFIVFPVIIIIGICILASVEARLQTVNLYTSSCEGDWTGPTLIQGEPEVDAKGSEEEFTLENSAHYTSGPSNITCKNFDSPPPGRMKSRKLGLSLAIVSKIEGPIPIEEEMPEVEVPEEEEAPEEELPEEEIPTGEELISPEDYITSHLVGEEEPLVIEEIPVSPLDLILRISVSLDQGETWDIIGVIDQVPLSNALNAGYLMLDIPNSLFAFEQHLEDIQVRVEGLVGTPDIMEVYLDSLWVEVTLAQPREAYLEGERVDFAQNENPHFRFRVEDPKGFLELVRDFLPFQPPEEKIDVSLRWLIVSSEGEPQEEVPVDFEMVIAATEDEAEWEIILSPLNTFRPGGYAFLIKAADPEWNVLETHQEFNWGLLAINTQKSIFVPSEIVEFNISSVNETGDVICDASLNLTITDPSGDKEILSTDDGTIIARPECQFHSLTSKPDYEAEWALGDLAGTYQLELEAEIIGEDGNSEKHKIKDSFEVRESVPFDISRITSTRILPNARHEMRIRIQANEAYKGPVIEALPPGFLVSDIGWRKIITEEDIGLRFAPSEPQEAPFVLWNVEFEPDGVYELGYIFDAPDISPQFWLLGPLVFYKTYEGLTPAEELEEEEEALETEPTSTIPLSEPESPKVPSIINEPNLLFSEARSWQITADILGEHETILAMPTYFSEESYPNQIESKIFRYFIPADGKIIAKINSLGTSVNGIFRLLFYKTELAALSPGISEDDLLGILNVGAGQFILDEIHDVSLPLPEFLPEELFPFGKVDASFELEVKKEWENVFIKINAIPLSAHRVGKEILTLEFSPQLISLDETEFLGVIHSGPFEKNKEEFNFTASSSGELILEVVESGRGGGVHFVFLDDKGIGFIDSGYVKEKIAISDIIASGPHKVLLAHGAHYWEDNEGDRIVNVYFQGEIAEIAEEKPPKEVPEEEKPPEKPSPEELEENKFPPRAAARAHKSEVNVGQPILFDASKTRDIDSEKLFFTWNFGDGTRSYKKIDSHKYSEPGTYNVVLLVSDGQLDSYAFLTVTITEPIEEAPEVEPTEETPETEPTEEVPEEEPSETI